ncbi:uncharacterized protein LOC119730170 [Patiria miniata]|uniref:PKD domain-containing protein n=1 Tax=Patiria miniata TaxID=46514 RepID=A0A914A4W2_PATMI|nr:uncharacterized protein LOC119730170 [Patiria miniata]
MRADNFFSLCFLLVNHTRIYELISSNAIDLDPFAFPLHLNGSYSRVAAIRTDVCPGNVTSCFHGFTISMWLLANDTSVTDEGVYYLSSGAQRTESCGFYFRLDSVNSDPNGSRVGVFDIAVATADTLWKVRYQARMSVKSHVMMSWGPDVRLDVYIDGICAGNPDTDEGYQRYPLTSCSDDPFQDLYIGGRNDLASGGFAVADVGELIIWDAWKNPIDVYNLEQEGKAACDGNGFKYAAIGGDGPQCYCIANYTYMESDPEGSCNVCPGYTGITCGSSDSLSLYHLPSFLQQIPAQETIQGLSVGLDGVQSDEGNYSVTTQTNINISFYVSMGEDVLYSISGDNRLAEVQTFEASTYLLFPEAGLYHLTVIATNQISHLERELWVTAKENPVQLGVPFVEIYADLLAGMSELVHVWVVIANGSPDMSCSLDFGDGKIEPILGNQSSHGLTHRYDSSGVFLITVSCEGPDLRSMNASATIVIQERITITLNTTFRVIKVVKLLQELTSTSESQ